MKISIGLAALAMLASVGAFAQNAYITNFGSDTVSVVDTRTNTVVANITVGVQPDAVAVTPDGTKVFVTTFGSQHTVAAIDARTNSLVATISPGGVPFGVAANNQHAYVANYQNVSVIDTSTDAVTDVIPLPDQPQSVAASVDGKRVYVANPNDHSRQGTVTVIDATTDAVITTILVGFDPSAIAVSPDGSRVYVGNSISYDVSVIDTATNAVVATIPTELYQGLDGIAVSPDGGAVYVTTGGTDLTIIDATTDTVKTVIPVGIEPSGVSAAPNGQVYVANGGGAPPNTNGALSVIDPTTNTVVDTITSPSFNVPGSIGQFIQQQLPAPQFAGTPGASNCHGQSVAALAQQYGGLPAAAAALGYSSVQALQNAIAEYCAG